MFFKTTCEYNEMHKELEKAWLASPAVRKGPQQTRKQTHSSSMKAPGSPSERFYHPYLRKDWADQPIRDPTPVTLPAPRSAVRNAQLPTPLITRPPPPA